MQPRMSFWRRVGVLAAVVVLAGIAPASAQTQGMERRGERRNVRAGARAAKQACSRHGLSRLSARGPFLQPVLRLAASPTCAFRSGEPCACEA
jgi:hypothetical protein